MYIGIFILLAMGFYILGYVFGRQHYTNQTVGELKVAKSDEDGPYLFLELSESVEAITRKDHVVLKVNLKNYISQD